jgi:hypothetical protein
MITLFKRRDIPPILIEEESELLVKLSDYTSPSIIFFVKGFFSWLWRVQLAKMRIIGAFLNMFSDVL